ncbi:threonine-phosphate decarboxylase CobD [Halocella sp. SP3-1]|uniref:threonine-phosphate decarboxylase CobD n=1 Tax=Halocella sp. SP3-1 TaxID=2382161 RepID=UPI000F755B63|nr:threonine-phosphate decarboxylase CobD [Halocella sp. SP3-1]AZO95916.1 threonine-phosphate decarboxylase [Halocella sp. SP3-1]
MEHYHGGNIAAAVKKYGLNKDSIIDFSANINFLGLPEIVVEGIRDNLHRLVHYPEPAAVSFKEIVAAKIGVDYNNVIAGNGAVDLIYQFVKVIKPATALVVEPTFSEYELAVKSIGGKVKHFNLSRDNSFIPEVSRVKEEINGVELLFLCNPNNPSGQLLARHKIIDLLDYAVKQGVFLFIDEAFINFIDQPADYTVVKLVKDYERLFVLRSLTKLYAIPGLRLGYGIGNEKVIKEMEMARDPWSVNYLAQLAGELIFEDEDYYNLSRKKMAIERDYLYQGLCKIRDFIVYQPTANFIFIDLSKGKYNADQLTDLLAEEGILIRNCKSYRGLGKDFIRVAVKSRQDNKILLKKLKKLYSGKYGIWVS